MDYRLPLAGYAIAAGAHLALLALLLASTRGRRAGGLLPAALVMQVGWAATMTLAVLMPGMPMALLDATEVLRSAAWFAFLIGMPAPGPHAASDQAPIARLRRAGAIGAAALCAGALTLDAVGAGDRLAYAAKVLLAIYGLVLVEQVYRNTAGGQRWALKFLCVALLALFGYDLAMYSDALLYGRLDTHWWAARGYGHALLAPLIGVAASRSRHWKFDITVSRQIVFHSATLLGAGLYLLAVATIGWYARDFGGGWGAVAQAVLLFAALLALLMVGLSGRVRAWLRVTVAKNFFRYRYDYRREWLQFTDRLSLGAADAIGAGGSPPGPAEAAGSHPAALAANPAGTGGSAGAAAAAGTCGRSAANPPAGPVATEVSMPADSAVDAPDLLGRRTIEAIAALVESHCGALWLRAADGRAYEPAATWNMRDPGVTVSAESSLATFLRARQWVVSVPDWRDDPGRYEGLHLPPWCLEPGRFELIVPLALHAQLLGFVALGPTRTPIVLDWEVTDLLKTVGRQAASYLGQQQAVSALVQARQFESFNRMSAFVVHDLKNLVAQLSLMMANAARHRHNPEFQADMLSTVENVLERMRGLLLQLRVGARPVEQPAIVPAADALRAALEARRGIRPEPAIEIAPGADALQVRAHRDRLERVLGHLIQNAAEATPPDGRITLRLARAQGGAAIEVSDTGRGMSEEFVRRRLFKPFQSTKSHGMGIGTFESREYVHELGGRLEVESREGAGTTFRVWLPAVDTPAVQAPADAAARAA